MQKTNSRVDIAKLWTFFSQAIHPPYPQVLALTGSRDGKILHTAADALCQYFLCPQVACTAHQAESCQQCQHITAGSHPDLSRWHVEQAYTVEQARHLNYVLMRAPQQAPFTVALLLMAQAAKAACQNAWLKPLEEAPAHAIVILATTHWQLLLPTVRSRCQRLELPHSLSETALAEPLPPILTQLLHQALMLNALPLHQLIEQIAVCGKKENYLQHIIVLLLRWLHQAVLYHAGLAEDPQPSAARFSSARLATIAECCQQIYQQFKQQVTPQLLLEQLLLAVVNDDSIQV